MDIRKEGLMNKQNSHLFKIIFAGILVYGNSLNNLFVWDDIFVVITNDFIKGTGLLRELFLKPLFYFADPGYLYYRPLQGLSNVLDYSLWGINPLGFHITNVLLHIATATVIYFLLRTLFGDHELSFFTSLLFVVHPINSSVVNYVTSRADILVALFTASSLALFLSAHKNHTLYVVSLLCCICALLSKESAILIPVLLIFVNEMHLKLNNKKTGFHSNIVRSWYFAFLITCLAYLFVRTHILALKANLLPQDTIAFLTMAYTSLKMVFYYIGLIFFPVDLHMLRAIGISQMTLGRSISCILILIALALASLNLYRRNKIIFIAAGLFFICIAPHFSIAFRNPEYYCQQKAVMEEHWLYTAALGIIIPIFYIIKKYGRHSGTLSYRIIFSALILYFSTVTIMANTHWKNNYTLFTHTLRYVNYSATVYRNLGWIYINRNDNRKALEMYGKALALKQSDSQKKILYKDTAYAYFLNGESDKAIDLCRSALKLDFNYAEAHATLGLIYSKNDLSSAIEEWKIALDKDRFNTTAFNKLLALGASDGLLSQYLIERYKEALDQNKGFENYKAYSALGMVYLSGGRYPEALLFLEKARMINPYNVEINNALATLYAYINEYDLAIKFFRIALKLNPFHKQAYLNLSALYTHLGIDKEARRFLKKADHLNMYY